MSSPVLPQTPAATDTIRVIVADDHQIVRVGLRMLLGIAPDIEVVGEAEDGEEALRIIDELVPDVAVLDIDMPHMDGLAATKALVERGSPTRVLILTMCVENEYRLRLLAAGAAGYLTKSVADRALASAIREVAAGRGYSHPLPPSAPSAYAPSAAAPAAWRAQYERLSARERSVLVLTAEGWSASEVGERLGLSAKTVETYRERIAHKLDFTHRADYLRLCLRLGLLRAQ